MNITRLYNYLILLLVLASCKSHKTITEKTEIQEEQKVTESVASSSMENTEKSVTASSSAYEIEVEYSEPDESGKQHIVRKKIKGQIDSYAKMEQSVSETKTEENRQIETEKKTEIKSEKETKQTSGGVFASFGWEVVPIIIAAILCIILWCRVRKLGYF